MTSRGITRFQIGKNGITEGTIESLKLAFKTHVIIKVSVLRSAARDKTKIKEMANELVAKLGKGFKFRTIGFTIVLMKRN